MKIVLKLLLAAILSLSVGVAFAAPLFIADMNIRPYHEPLPKGMPAELAVDIVYTNFTTNDTPATTAELGLAGEPKNLSTISYFAVLNITNTGDNPTRVSLIQFDACQNVTKGISHAFINSTSVSGWSAKGAWVDGIWYNVTWSNDTWPFFDQAGNLAESPYAGPSVDGYWMEGVQIADKYFGDQLVATYLNMNGTWTDVTGRITVDRPAGTNLFENAANATSETNVLFSELRFFDVTTSDEDNIMGPSYTTGLPAEFNDVWAPHESRLIVVSADRSILSSILNESKAAMLQSGQITLRAAVHSSLVGNITELGDTSTVSEDIKQVQIDTTADVYVYNSILADNQIFQLDTYGAEAFIKTGS